MRRAARCFLLFAALVSQFAWAQSPGRIEGSEANVKAAFLYKFGSFVEWPVGAFSSADSPIVFGIAGADDVAAELERIASGRNLQGHPATVRRIKEGEGIPGVHVLFIGGNHANLRGLLREAQRPGTLVVTEIERGLELGSAVNFIVTDERVGFEVSVEAAERNGMKISSRMLNVARRVVSK